MENIFWGGLWHQNVCCLLSPFPFTWSNDCPESSSAWWWWWPWLHPLWIEETPWSYQKGTAWGNEWGCQRFASFIWELKVDGARSEGYIAGSWFRLLVHKTVLVWTGCFFENEEGKKKTVFKKYLCLRVISLKSICSTLLYTAAEPQLLTSSSGILTPCKALLWGRKALLVWTECWKGEEIDEFTNVAG